MQHSILYLFNPNDFLKIRNRSTQTKINIFSDIYNLKKKKQKQISKIEKTNILIENPKTHNKNESNLNFIPKPKKLRKKNVPLSMSIPAIWWSKSGKGTDDGGETELCHFLCFFLRIPGLIASLSLFLSLCA